MGVGAAAGWLVARLGDGADRGLLGVSLRAGAGGG